MRAGLPSWSRYDGVPQTPADAHEAGWRFLTVSCLECRRVGSIELEGLTVRQWRRPLARLGRALRCRCGSRQVDVAFAEVERPAGRASGREKSIWFVGDRTMRPPRG